MRALSKTLLALLLVAALTGCGEFFMRLGLLIECGPFPMSFDNCRPPRDPVIQPEPPESIPTF